MKLWEVKGVRGGQFLQINMFYDLSIPWFSNPAETQRTLAFLSSLDYSTVALNSIPLSPPPFAAQHTSPIPSPLPFPISPKLRILTRLTLPIPSPSSIPRLATLAPHYDILALRPTCEKTLFFASQAQECDLISFDLSLRYPFHFRPKLFSTALARGLKIEICYSGGALGGQDANARRNLIGNATSLIRATRGRGIVISSEARRALGVRGPWDVINFAAIWGMGAERGREAIGEAARDVVVQAEMKRRSFRGVVDVLYGGEKPAQQEKTVEEKGNSKGKGKRKADAMLLDEKDVREKPLSKTQIKKRAKKARLEAEEAAKSTQKHVEQPGQVEAQNSLQPNEGVPLAAKDGELGLPEAVVSGKDKDITTT